MTLDVPPQLLRALVAVLRTGSFTGASEQTGFTQSAVSKQIAALEEAVGAPLFQRGPRGVVPTPAALGLARHASAILDHLDTAAREIADLDRPLLGRVSLGAFATAAMHLAPETIARVTRAHPAIDVVLVESSTPVQLRRLRTGRLDLAVVAVGSEPDGAEPDGAEPDGYGLEGIDTEVLPAASLHVAVGERHPWAHARELSVDDLAGADWVVGRGARGEPQFGAWPALAQPRVVAEIDSWSSRLAFVAAGLGVTTVPALAIAGLPRGVVAVPVAGPRWAGRSLRVAWSGELDPAARLVRSALHAVAADIAATHSAPREMPLVSATRR
ncbi:LysR family transcriptional regulator [Rathayibacter sp. VKM Ac-2926]|uniref:LysR family transcriptional regulator n=1 Tax=Rathayibacter sp. VKM Ac-2926 TaxID=2929477 RepID=UPI001FB1E72B|nr:LysR family transcriptional regulator [Rathayibacter sp. VKM Ac-2926]MCJ1703856.1 LysR family transcriptional regulator [Rathayibacter sp. VKM Ac-2926]